MLGRNEEDTFLIELGSHRSGLKFVHEMSLIHFTHWAQKYLIFGTLSQRFVLEILEVLKKLF